jgi:hypothetical protein
MLRSLADLLQGHTSFDLLDIFCKMGCHVFNIDDRELQSIGVGVYIMPSFFNHSCACNVVISFVGPRLFARVIKPITAGEEMLISYEDLTHNTKTRRCSLRNIYFFDCHCSECLNFLQDDSTDKGRLRVMVSSADRQITVIEYQIYRLKSLIYHDSDGGDVSSLQFTCQSLQNYYRELKNLVATTHYLMLLCRSMLIDVMIWIHQFTEANVLQNEHLEALELLLPINHPSIVVELARSGRLHRYLNHMQTAFHIWSTAINRAHICFSPDHQLYKWLDHELRMLSIEQAFQNPI